MIKKETFSLEYIQKIKKSTKADLAILERSIYALGLLEALANVGMKFIFKGGTSLLLLLNEPKRLSTDIDIIVPSKTNVEEYLEKASKIFPFKKLEQQIRKGKNNIEKRHFKFTYDSPVNKREFYILLDVLYEENHYSSLIKKKIEANFLLTEEPFEEIYMPSVDCILGDKLTAFAPHTTGIKFNEDKELEIIKQMYDVASLFDVCEKFDDIYKSYMATVKTEIAYRALSVLPEHVLIDTIDAAKCIASRGQIIPEEYSYYLDGIRKIVNHIYSERYSAEKAAIQAYKVMYIASCILKNKPFDKTFNKDEVLKVNISDEKYKKLVYIKKIDIEAYFYLIKTIELLK